MNSVEIISEPNVDNIAQSRVIDAAAALMHAAVQLRLLNSAAAQDQAGEIERIASNVFRAHKELAEDADESRTYAPWSHRMTSARHRMEAAAHAYFAGDIDAGSAMASQAAADFAAVTKDPELLKLL